MRLFDRIDIFIRILVIQVFFVNLLLSYSVSGQISGFSIPDTICINTPVPVSNITTASTYYWNFCSANLSTIPIGTNLGNPFGLLDLPVYSQLIKQGNDHFLFQASANASGVGNGKVVRYFLGNSFSNYPISYTLLPNSLVDWNAECLRILLDDNGNYYGFMTNGTSNTILRFNFGTDLWNTPTVTNLGNLGGLDMPHGIEIVRDNGIWYGLITNSFGNTVTRLTWGTSLTNMPTGTNLGNLGSLNAPKALQLIKDSNQNWFLFATNYSTSSLTRLSFGTSLANTPIGYNTGPISGINGPEGITMLKDCDNYFGYVANYAVGSNSLCRISFPNGLNGPVVGYNIGNIGNIYRPGHFSNIYRQNDTLFMYLGNRGTGATVSSIVRLRFNNCSASSIISSTLQNPPPFSYSTPGTYNITLIVDEGLPTQQVYCHDIVVVNHFNISIAANLSYCVGDTAILTAVGSYPAYVWSTGDTTKSIKVTTGGAYWVKIFENTSCESTANINVVFHTPVPLSLGVNQTICPAESIVLQANQPFNAYVWSTGQTQSWISINQTGSYWLSVTDIHGCHSIDTVVISHDPGVITNVNKMICPGTGYFVGGQIQYNPGVYYDTLFTVDLCDSVVITQLSFFALPPDNLIDTSHFCLGETTVLNAFSGNFQYLWNTGQNSPSIQVSQPGLYYVTITDSNNCISKDSISVLNYPVPLPDLGNDTTICVYQSIMLDPGGGFVTYLWYNNASTQQITVDSTGVYSVQVSNIHGCLGYDSILVDVMPEPVINLGNDTILCIGLSVVLNPGIGFSSYLWNSGSVSQTISATQSGSYIVTVTYGPQCIAMDSVMVGFVLGNMIDLGEDTAFCNGNSLVLSPGSGYASYSWSNGAVTSFLQANQSGIYSVSVTRSDGCFDSDSISIVVHPTPVYNVDFEICQGDSLLCGGNYQHHTGVYYDTLSTVFLCDSVIITQLLVNDSYLIIRSISICPYDSVYIGGSYQNQPGIYYDTLQTISTCDSVIETELILHPIPIAALGNDTVICQGDTLNLDALNQGSLYLWSNGSAARVVSITLPGIYSVTITNSQNCQIADSISILVQELPVIQVMPENPMICVDSSIILTFPNNYQYAISPQENFIWLNQMSGSASPKNTTQFILTAIDSIGCQTDTAFLVVVKYPPESHLEDSLSSCIGFPILLSVGNQPSNIYCNWSTGESGTEIFVNTPGTFWVMLSNEVCKATDTVLVEECSTMEIPNVFTPNGDGTNETFHPKGDIVNGYNLTIFNRWGVILFHTEDFYQGWDGNYQGNQCSNGTYFYLIKYEDIAFKQNQKVIYRSGSVTMIR